MTALATGLVGTAVFGVGAFSHWDDLSDGTTWLWSSVTGEVIRVNAHSGQVDLVQSVEASADHPVRLAQNDKHLVVHDLATGSLASVDLVNLDFTGETTTGGSGNHRFVLGDDAAVIIDQEGGEIRRVDPSTLQPIGEPLRLAGPLIGGEFDRDGLLWVAAPSQGTVVAIRSGEEQPEVVDSVAVGEPGADLALTVLDSGALAIDRGTDEVSLVGDGSPEQATSPVSLSGAEVPARTVGGAAAITLADAASVVAVTGLTDGSPKTSAFAVHGTRPETALTFADKVYVPYSEEGVVREFSVDGGQERTIRVPDAGESDLELEVREEHLFINAPESESALVVDADGGVREVSKYDPEPTEDGEGEGGGEDQDDRGEEFVEGPDVDDYVPQPIDLPDASTPDDLPAEEDGPAAREEEARPDRSEEDDDPAPQIEEPPGEDRPTLPETPPDVDLPELPELPELPTTPPGHDDDEDEDQEDDEDEEGPGGILDPLDPVFPPDEDEEEEPEEPEEPEQPEEPGTEEPPTDPVDPPTDPVEPPTDPVEPPTDPVDPPTDPVEPPTDPVEPPTDPVEPPTDPVEPPTDPVVPPVVGDPPPAPDPGTTDPAAEVPAV
ncbi:hypothetical protein [Nocardiopsis trehalosi]|uniref:hypothetical protein n=1 Tax=Nocardiopsis trehalosi TaxID=109329 RepID=UPI0008336211|nr:hypothetical protein [Nocardiopsis trehalosi]